MGFEEYAKRINSIREIETFEQLPKEKLKQNRFTIENIHMILEEIEKSKLRIRDTILAAELYIYRFPTLSSKRLLILKEEKSERLMNFYNWKNTNLFK